MLVTADQVLDGMLVIEGDTITCVAVTCDTPAGATLITVAEAFVFPGFIDAHNHVAYNVLPRWTPPKRYQRRSQWQAAAAYKAFKKPYADLIAKGLFCEMVKYGEIKALVSGVTTIQGTAPDRACFRTLIRNAENQNELGLPRSHTLPADRLSRDRAPIWTNYLDRGRSSPRSRRVLSGSRGTKPFARKTLSMLTKPASRRRNFPDGGRTTQRSRET